MCVCVCVCVVCIVTSCSSAVPVLPAHQLVAGSAGVRDAAAERLALAVHVAVRDLLGLAAPDRCKSKGEISNYDMKHELLLITAGN